MGMERDSTNITADHERNWRKAVKKLTRLRSDLGLNPNADLPDVGDFRSLNTEIKRLEGVLGRRAPRYPCRVCMAEEFAIENAVCRGCAIREIMASMTAEAFRRVCRRVRKYGIEPADYAYLYMAQKGVCAACYEPSPFGDLVVDHDHSTGDVRGLLCGHCNTGLGFFRDNAKALTRAAAYLNHPPIDRIPEQENRHVENLLSALGA